MSSVSRSGQNDEIVNNNYIQGTVVVSITQIEAKVGASKLTGRQLLRIYNNSSNIIYIGPSGVTISNGEPLEKKQWIDLGVGDSISIFMIAASGANNIIVSEFS